MAGAVDWSALYSYAQSLLGTPYVYGGTGNGGYDCSGFTQALYNSVGVNIGRDTTQQLQSGQAVGQDGNWQEDIADLQPGDLIFYGAQGASGPNAHVVMYIGNDQVIQAGGSNVNVTQLFQSASADEPFLGVRRYTSFTNVPQGQADPNSAMDTGPAGNTSAPSATASGQGLSMSDIPQVDSWIRSNWGSDSWLLDVPQVKSILENAAVNGLDTSQVQASIEQTTWWKTTSTALKNFEQDSAANPGDYSFTTPGSKASQMAAQIQNTAATNGVQLTEQAMQTLATNALKFGWTAPQIQAAIGSQVNNTNAAPVDQQLKAAAGQYLMNVSPGVLQSWAQNIAGGTQTMDQFNAYLQNMASQKWSGYSSQLQQGNTMQQLTNSLRDQAASVMEVDPSTIDFVNNPTYAKIIDYQPPTPLGGTPQPKRVMTQSEMDQYLKSQNAYAGTQNARDSVAQVADQIVSTWGKV